MRLFVWDDSAPGLVAVGSMPIGVLAIGAMPVGLVAIGFGSVGGVAVSCGGSVGVVALGCGLAVGGYARNVGFAFGLRAAEGVGGAVSVVPSDDDDDPFPSLGPKSSTPYDVALARATDPSALASAEEGWVRVVPTRGSRAEPWGIAIDGAPVTVEPAATAMLQTYGGDGRPIVAHAKVVTGGPAGEAAGYRAPVAHARSLHVDRILLPPPAEDAAERRSVRAEQVWWLAKVAAKGFVLLVCLSIAGVFVAARIGELSMTRKAEAKWTGTLKRAEGMVFPSDASCVVAASMVSDGTDGFRAYLTVTCGSVVLWPEGRASCNAAEAIVDGTRDHFRYALRCEDRGRTPDEDHEGRPRLSLDTAAGTATLDQALPTPFHVEIALTPTSSDHVGAPLFFASAPASPAAPSSRAR
ncbi:MAG: hypothetical protein JST00_39285 [Deltaproteobacteria bacterium]|nr:hypothetical protein [Deltaproteobacteria bacterium]